MNRTTLVSALVTGSALVGAGYFLSRRPRPRALASNIIPIITPVIDLRVAEDVLAPMERIPGDEVMVVLHSVGGCDFSIFEGAFDLHKIDLQKNDFRATKARVNGIQVGITRFRSPIRPENPDTTLKPLSIFAEDLDIKDGSLTFHDLRYPRQTEIGLDPHYISLKDLNISGQDLYFNQDLSISGDLVSLSAQTADEMFSLKDLVCPDFVITGTYLNLPKFRLQTAGSALADSISATYAQYSAFKTLADEVFWAGRLSDLKISLNEILYLFPALQKNEFLNSYRNQTITAGAELRGSLNRLNLVNLIGSFGDNISLTGSGTLRNAFNKSTEPQFNLNFTSLQSSMAFLKQAIPSLKLPDNF